jgi:hypothetical protein
MSGVASERRGSRSQRAVSAGPRPRLASVRWYVLALVWVLVGSVLYAFQILSRAADLVA